jgi:class 3 adenylate cyclase
MSSPEHDPDPAESWLEVPDGGLFWLDRRCGIGRLSGNELMLEAPTLSRHHALLLGNPAGYTLTDLRSSNGSYLNGVPVTRPVPLRDGDEIRLGDVVLRFRCLRPEESGAVLPAAAVTSRAEDQRPRTCCFLIADVAGYSRMIAEAGNEAATLRLRDWIAGLRPVIEQHGGHINSYIGDGVFAWWPQEAELGTRVLAALGALEEFRRRSPLPFRVIVHHGTALLSHSDRGEEMTGRDVNFVFRAEKIAKQLQTNMLLSEAAVHGLELADRCRHLGSATVDGIDGVFQFFRPPALNAGAE